MTKAEILAFLNNNPACHLAIIEGNKPHVRGMLIYQADKNGIVFHTAKTKDLHKQLSVNPEVELCFNNYKDNIQVRVSGKMELVEDLALKKEIVSKRKFLQPWVEERGGYDFIAVYCLKKGVATVWTMAANFDPKTYIRL
jgi:pyridoxamine 5'-phosphate oxidase